MKKYIILGGCSYTYRAQSYLEGLLNKLSGKKNTPLDRCDIKIIHIGGSSASNEFITQTITTTIQSLLDNKVNPKDILVINNFTQIGRQFAKLPYEYHSLADEILMKDVGQRRYIHEPDITDYYHFSPSLIRFKNEIYSFFISNHNLNGFVKDWYNYENGIRHIKKNIIEHFESYLSSIVILQSFVKKHNIETISFLMNNVFDGWGDNFEHVYNKHTEFNLPSTKGTKHISEINDYTKILWDCIDLDMFVFHSTEENKYGGIDEYMLDKYPDKEYVQSPEREDLIFGNHPTEIIYEKFTHDYMVDKLKNWINEIHS
jgi:hypothetical protein